MNYYGTRRRGHDLAFHSELRDALFASGLPFVLSINDVPLYSRAGSITRLCSGKNGSKPKLLVCLVFPEARKRQLRRQSSPGRSMRRAPGQSCVWRRNGWGNPVASAGLRLQSCAQPRIARPAPGPHQARARPQSDFGMERVFQAFCAQPFLGLKAPFWDERAHGDMVWALVSGATFRRFDSSPVPRRADVLETGD